jgi:hypothetical protein
MVELAGTGCTNKNGFSSAQKKVDKNSPRIKQNNFIISKNNHFF